jgi:serine/threonine-protein kinase
LTEAPYSVTLPSISPDGNWVAYTSDESGRMEVYVSRFPSMRGKWLVSKGGGLEPVWGADGRSLFYRSLNHGVMELSVRPSGDNIEIGSPERLFDVFATLDMEERAFDLAPDGKTFVANAISEEHMRAPMTVVVDWTAGIESSLTGP